jgi:hypothetical protein
MLFTLDELYFDGHNNVRHRAALQYRRPKHWSLQFPIPVFASRSSVDLPYQQRQNTARVPQYANLQLYNPTVHHHQHLLSRMLTLSLVIQLHDLPNTLDRCST